MLSRRIPFATRKIRGVTLVELMVALVIVAIGMTIAVPGFQRMTARNRVATQTNEMLLAINLARSEATRIGRAVDIQAAAPSTSNEFGGGWCVVAATDNPGDCSGTTIRQFDALSGGSTMDLVDAGGATSIRFTGRGAVSGGSEVDIDLCLTGQSGRRIHISPIGRSKSHSPTDADEDRRPEC